ncbi:MAG: hypothetical protein R2911_43460 [Caldilineaceae bacterium]
MTQRVSRCGPVCSSATSAARRLFGHLHSYTLSAMVSQPNWWRGVSGASELSLMSDAQAVADLDAGQLKLS